MILDEADTMLAEDGTKILFSNDSLKWREIYQLCGSYKAVYGFSGSISEYMTSRFATEERLPPKCLIFDVKNISVSAKAENLDSVELYKTNLELSKKIAHVISTKIAPSFIVIVEDKSFVNECLLN